MTAPTEFCIQLIPSRYDGWAIDGPEAEHAYLPRLGPTSWALLRAMYARADRSTDAPTRFRTSDVAEAVGASPARAWSSLGRLIQFRLLVPVTAAADDVPVWALGSALPRLTWREWRRLPESVQARHAALRPVDRPSYGVHRPAQVV